MYSIQGSQLSPAGGAGKGPSTSFPEAGVHSAFTFLCLNCPIFGQWDKLAPSDILTMSEASLHPQDVLAGLVFSGPALDASLLQGACVGLSQSGEAVCLLGPL